MTPQIFSIEGYNYFKERTQKLLLCTCKNSRIRDCCTATNLFASFNCGARLFATSGKCSLALRKSIATVPFIMLGVP